MTRSIQISAAPQPAVRHDLPRRQQLVSASWLADLLVGLPVAAAPGRGWHLLEVGSGGMELFLRQHIPGAGYLDTEMLEQAPLWNKVADPALLRTLLAHGIRHDSTVILYGRNTLAAARAAHLMLYAGVADVRLLDGGLAAWVDAGGALESGLPHRYPPAADFGIGFPAHPEYLIDTRQVKTLLRQPGAALVSIRSWDEFCGRTSGYTYITAKGDIPGARWGRAGTDVNDMSDFHNPDGTMKASSEILAFWHAAGLQPEQQTVFYCGTGWRASLAFFYAWLMGWQQISVYDGGWYEWSSDPDNPRVVRSAAAGRDKLLSLVVPQPAQTVQTAPAAEAVRSI